MSQLGQRIVGHRVVEGVGILSFFRSVRVEHSDSELFNDELRHLTDDLGRRRILIDLSELSSYMPNTLIGRMISTWRKIRFLGGSLKICAISPIMMEVFQVVKLHRIFDLHPDRRAEPEDILEMFADTFPGEPMDPSLLAWNDGMLRKMAQVISTERAFEDLPYLGDALEEAGCTSPEILDHCHNGGEHVRGCWLLEKLLRGG